MAMVFTGPQLIAGEPSKIFQFPISIHNLSPPRERILQMKTLKILVFVLSTRFSSSHFSLNLPISTCDSLESSMSFVKSLKYKFSSSIGCLRIMMIKQKLFCRKCNFCYYFFSHHNLTRVFSHCARKMKSNSHPKQSQYFTDI